MRYLDATVDLDDLFLFEAKRRVMKDRTVSLDGRLYEVDALLVGHPTHKRARPSWQIEPDRSAPEPPPERTDDGRCFHQQRLQRPPRSGSRICSNCTGIGLLTTARSAAARPPSAATSPPTSTPACSASTTSPSPPATSSTCTQPSPRPTHRRSVRPVLIVDEAQFLRRRTRTCDQLLDGLRTPSVSAVGGPHLAAVHSAPRRPPSSRRPRPRTEPRISPTACVSLVPSCRCSSRPRSRPCSRPAVCHARSTASLITPWAAALDSAHTVNGNAPSTICAPDCASKGLP